MADETTNEVKEVKEESNEVAAAPAPDSDAMAGLSASAQKIIEQIENMTVLELNALVKAIEKKFGVSAAAVSVAAAPGAGADAAEEQSLFAVELTNAGAQKIAVIKVVKEVLSLGLKEAKDLVDGAPSLLKEGMKKEEAEEIKAKIEAAGGAVTLK